jgi:hypothetical protein
MVYVEKIRVSMVDRDLDKNKLGLCADCTHAQQFKSSKGSTFLLCGLSKTDPRFPKYPRLPVLACAGYRKNDESETPEKPK